MRRVIMADEAWLESVAMRPMLEALLESVCKDKPDVLLAYAIVWLRACYPQQASAALCLPPPVEWRSRTDVDPSAEGLTAYLKEIYATDILEGILERAIRSQPVNVVAFVLDECAAMLTGVSRASGVIGGGGGNGGLAGGYVGQMFDATIDGSAPQHTDAPAPKTAPLFEAVAASEVEQVATLLEAGVPADAREPKTLGTTLRSAAEG
jgi:hypothetical protein